MTSWLIFLLVIAFCLSMVIAMLRDCDEALREADHELMLDRLWDDIDAHLSGASRSTVHVRTGEAGDSIVHPVTEGCPRCVVCGDLGCEFCPRVDA